MLFFSAFTALLSASAVLAVPTPVVVDRAAVEDRGLLDALTSSGTVTQLQTITSTLKSNIVPVLSQIQSSTSGSGLTTILSNAGLSTNISSTSIATANSADLITLLNDLSTLIPTDQIIAIKTALQKLPTTISSDLYSLIAKVISVVKQIATAQNSSASLVTSSTSGGLASLLSGASTLSNLQTVITQVITSLHTINTGISNSASVTGVDIVAQIFSSLKTSTDSSLAGIITNSGKIVSGFTTALKLLMSSVTGLISQLGLSSLASILKL